MSGPTEATMAHDVYAVAHPNIMPFVMLVMGLFCAVVLSAFFWFMQRRAFSEGEALATDFADSR